MVEDQKSFAMGAIGSRDALAGGSHAGFSSLSR